MQGLLYGFSKFDNISKFARRDTLDSQMKVRNSRWSRIQNAEDRKTNRDRESLRFRDSKN